MKHKHEIQIAVPILLILAAAVCAAVPALALSPAWTIVDPFTCAQCAGPGCDPPEPATTGSGIPGGERDVLAQPLAGSSALQIEGGSLAVTNDGPDGLSAYLVVWDGADGDETAIDYDGLDADLLATCVPGSARLLLRQTSLDGQAACTLTVYTDAGNWSTWSSGIVAQSNVQFTLSLDDFAIGAGGGVDWHDVGAAALFVDTSLQPATELALAPLKFGCTPTAVELARFEAQHRGDAVLVEWETATEIENLGFNLYRQAAEGEFVRLNAALIPSQTPPGSPAGAVYTWPDGEVEPETIYHYRLEDVDVYGTTTLHGPVEAEWPAHLLLPVESQPIP